MAIHFRVFVDTLTKTKDGHPPDGTLASIFTVVKLYGAMRAVALAQYISFTGFRTRIKKRKGALL